MTFAYYVLMYITFGLDGSGCLDGVGWVALSRGITAGMAFLLNYPSALVFCT